MQTTPFGAFPAAEVLAAELEALADSTVSRKVSRLLQDFNTGLGQVASVPDPAYRKRVALLWRDNFLDRVAVNPAVDKFVRNVICTHAKPLLGDDNVLPARVRKKGPHG